MVSATVSARFLERQNIGRLLDDAEQLLGAGIIRANLAKIGRREKSALPARPNGCASRSDSSRDCFWLRAARLHNPKRDAFRGARPYTRHLAQLRDQIANRGWILGAFQSGAEEPKTGAGSVAMRRMTGSRRRRYHCSGSSRGAWARRARSNSAKASFQRRSRK